MLTMSRRLAMLGAATLAAPWARPARATESVIRIGSISDLAGPYADMSGPGTVNATKFAVTDYLATSPGFTIETRAADFQLKADVGLSILRAWFDEGVDVANDFPTSPLALGAATLVREKDKVALMTAPATADLTGRACGPNSIHWTYDTYALASTVGNALMSAGHKKWFFIAADYSMGSSMTRDLTAIITKRGGTVVGSVAHPFPDTTDFSSYLLQAQSSGADVLCLANSGTNAVNCIKQAAEFGLLRGGKLVVAAPLVEIPQIHEIGAETAQGMYTATSFYWDRNADCRAFAERLKPLNEGYMPNQNHAGAYAATTHYLKAVSKLGPAAAKASGRAAVAAMKDIPAEDKLFGHSVVREDGRVVHDMYLMQAKPPSEMRNDWDYMRIVDTVPGDIAFRPLSAGGCPMIKA